MNNIFLFEDHDRALKIWRRQGIKDLDLIHLDAHIDFGFHPARHPEKLLEEAGSVKELKANLEYSLAFLDYEKKLDKQTNLGNYIYPAIDEGIVRDFYWVIPGGQKEFRSLFKTIKNILRNATDGRAKLIYRRQNFISADFSGRKLFVCTLESLPEISRPCLLDIDTDFLVIHSLKVSDNRQLIGRRRPWILPGDLSAILKRKIARPVLTTIAYSTNGGWTPMRYRYFGDELAGCISPDRFSRAFKRNKSAALYFERFESLGNKESYWKAVKLNPAYRKTYNNYGPLFLSVSKLLKAKKEFLKVLQADKKNAPAYLGLGQIAFRKRDFKKAERYLSRARYLAKRIRGFRDIRQDILFWSAKTDFALKDFRSAKSYLYLFRRAFRLEPESSYLLGVILEKEKKWLKAVERYKDAFRLGMGSLKPLFRLLKIHHRLRKKSDIMGYVKLRYQGLKKNLSRLKKSSFKIEDKPQVLAGMKKELQILEKRMEELNERFNSAQ